MLRDLHKVYSKLAEGQGLEPRFTPSKGAVLPLNDPPMDTQYTTLPNRCQQSLRCRLRANGAFVSAFPPTWQGEAWDQYACANLAWINAGGVTQLVSYNDEDSLQHIAKFVREKNLGGTMVWESDGDTHGDATFKLSKAVMNGLNGKTTNINNQALKTCVAGGRE